MRVLLTNNTLSARAGSELYVRDIAIELMRRGHHPVAYSTQLGAVADELRGATVPVIGNLDSPGEPPDIIHGQHHYESLSAMLRFPNAPAIHYCHGWSPWQESPLRFPRILRYVAVDQLCRERLITEGGIPSNRIEVFFNFFDERRFPPRSPLPERPKLALAFSNTFNEQRELPLLREACAQCGIELHAVGSEMGQSEANPGELLAKYDLVFAKARAAIEAMAVGAAVILCNPGRLGGMVTADNFVRLRPLNFGVRTLDRPLELKPLIAEIERYSASESAHVSAIVRQKCELQSVVDRLINLYERVIEEWRHTDRTVSASADHAVARYLEQNSARFKGNEAEAVRSVWVDRCMAAETDRDRWSERCLAAENDRNRLLERCSAAESDRDKWAEHSRTAEANLKNWSERCIAAEADRDSRSERCLALEADRNRWSERCLNAEAERELLRPYIQLAEQRQQEVRQLEQDWRRRLESLNTEWDLRYARAEDKWAADHGQLMRDLQSSESQLRKVEFTLADLQGCFAWRVTKGLLESYPMRSLIRPAIRAMRKQWRSALAR